jgi:hypothetical protein
VTESEQEDGAVDTDDVYVQATMSFTDGPSVTVRELLFGLTPGILIEPDVDEEAGRYGFVVNAVDLEADDLVKVLRLCADNIELAAAREAEESGDD